MPSLIVALCVAGLAATGVAYAVDGPVRPWAINGGWLAIGVAATLGVWAARARASADRRRGWTLMTVACGAWLAGEVLWTLYTIDPGPASPNLADLGWFAFAVLGAASLWSLGQGRRRDARVVALELAPFVAAVSALVLALLWDSIHASELPPASVVTVLAYPVLYVSAALVALQAVAAGALGPRSTPGVAVILAGMVVEALGFIMWTPLLLDGTYVAGAHVVDIVFTVGLAMIALGSCVAGRLPELPAGAAEGMGAEVADRSSTTALLPGAALVALVTTQVTLLLGEAPKGPRLILVFAVAIVGATLAVRGAILRREQTSALVREREATAASERARAELDRYFTISSGLLCVAGFDGRFHRLNPAWTDTLGWTVDELLSQPLMSFVHPDDRAATLAEMKRLGKGIETLQFENRYRTKAGSYRWLSWKCRPDIAAGVVYASAHDVTDRRRLVEELAAARDEALEASRQKSAFLAMMSHEIRTPLNGVLGMAQLLAVTEMDREQRAHVETITTSGEALLTIINDILDFSKIEAGQLDLDLDEFDLRAAVEELGVLFGNAAHAKGLELAIDVADDLPAWVRSDPNRLRQILSNLVNNAVKFTPAGEVVVRAGVDPDDRSGRTLRFEVSDSGIGIAADALPRLFEPFAQADSSTTRRFGGSGLGLAIARRLAERLGGNIGAESEAGVGSTFWCTVRVDRVGATPAESAPRALTGVRVLVVDDNATNREILEQQLRSAGMRADTAETASVAVRLLHEAARGGDRYELVLLDFRMPDIDGIELARRVSDDPSLRGVKLILLTSVGGQNVEARDAGIDAWLTKPVRQSELLGRIAAVLAGVEPDQPQPMQRPIDAGRTGVRVLVAEDDEVNQAVATLMLRNRGLEVDIAPDGVAAVAMALDGEYAAVFMDCQMPNLDGYEATRRIRRQPAGESLPIIAMTASAMHGDRERCLAAGMDDYVSKPIVTEELDRTLDRWLPGDPDAPALSAGAVPAARAVPC